MRLISLILLLAISAPFQKCQSQNIETGILILSSSRGHLSFDLFVPGRLTTKKCLLSNFNELLDTAIRFGTYKEGLLTTKMLASAVTLTNESAGLPPELKTILVLPVEVEYAADEVMSDYADEFYLFEVTLNGKRIISTYNNKKPFFKKIRVLNLPKKGCT